jgi:hypothetical protein
MPHAVEEASLNSLRNRRTDFVTALKNFPFSCKNVIGKYFIALTYHLRQGLV